MKVRKGSRYVYNPCGWDVFDAKTNLRAGEIVTVIHPRGCPAPNTMGCCHVARDGETFTGLVSTGSLTKAGGK